MKITIDLNHPTGNFWIDMIDKRIVKIGRNSLSNALICIVQWVCNLTGTISRRLCRRINK